MVVAEKVLRKIIRESVRDAIREERLGLYEVLVPPVSKKEMQEIEGNYGTPAKYKKSDFKDMTDWVMK
ncbi:MAG: hypothetical protein HQL10_06370 [Nitrospirae bacterium]|nr:hypothetical protein [Nitrospirota bacterium]